MREILRLIATATVVAFGVTAIPTVANALPTDCVNFVGSDRRGYAKCTGGTGYYKVGMSCRPIGPFGFYGYSFTQQGNWARVGGVYQSVAQCPYGTTNWTTNGTYYAWIDQRAENI